MVPVLFVNILPIKSSVPLIPVATSKKEKVWLILLNAVRNVSPSPLFAPDPVLI